MHKATKLLSRGWRVNPARVDGKGLSVQIIPETRFVPMSESTTYPRDMRRIAEIIPRSFVSNYIRI